MRRGMFTSLQLVCRPLNRRHLVDDLLCCCCSCCLFCCSSRLESLLFCCPFLVSSLSSYLCSNSSCESCCCFLSSTKFLSCFFRRVLLRWLLLHGCRVVYGRRGLGREVVDGINPKRKTRGLMRKYEDRSSSTMLKS
jgi:hypothetical protein